MADKREQKKRMADALGSGLAENAGNKLANRWRDVDKAIREQTQGKKKSE